MTTVTAVALVAVAIALMRNREPEEQSAAPSNEPAAREQLDAVRPDFGDAVVETAAEARPDSIEPAKRSDGVLQNADSSGIRAFVDLRELPDVELVREELAELGGEARDPNWSAQMEARLQSELSQTNLTITGSYIECKTSTCIAIFIRPSGAYNQTEQIGPPNGAFTRVMLDISQSLGLLIRPPRQLLARNGALVHWQRFFRRCAPDWQCPQ